MSDEKAAKTNAEDALKYWIDSGFGSGGVVRKVDYAVNSQGVHPLLKGIKIVDTDTHFAEPPDLFTSRAPARLKDKVPYHKKVDGRDRWFVGDKDFGQWGGGNVIGRDHNKILGRLAYPSMEEGHPGAWELKPRLQIMDDMGIYAQICYQNSGVTQAGSLMALGDNDLAVSIIQMYNDAAAERQKESGQRVFTLAHLPIWDHKAMEAEVRRIIDMDIKGITLPDLPERYGIPGYLDEYWTGMFEMLSDAGVPLNYHLASALNPAALTWQGFNFEQQLTLSSFMFSFGNGATMANFMIGGRLDRHPKLKIGLIESGIGWLPFALEFLEHSFDESLASSAKKLQKRPWQYFRDHFWCTYWFEKIGPKQLLETIGVNKVMFETDFPHPVSLYPGVQDHLADTLGGYTFEVRKRVLERNAVELYNLPF